jgi:hypothetical protein
MEQNWTLSNLPPEGHDDVGPFFWRLYEESESEKDRLGLKERWIENHRLYRGGSQVATQKTKQSVTANIIFSNVQRTVANLTAKNPVAEAVSTDWQPQVDPETGEQIADDTDNILTKKIKEWWSESEQNMALVDSALNQENYGITIEKAVYDTKKRSGDIVIVDPFAFVICPGMWTDVSDAPYVGQAYPERTEKLKELYGDDVSPDNVRGNLGEEREDNRPMMTGQYPGTVPSGSTSRTWQDTGKTSRPDTTLVVELWVRDNSTVKKDDGEELKYPGGIRMVTITSDLKVLVDLPNPNINPALWENQATKEAVAQTYLFSHYPFWFANSYRDPQSIWGFAASEQVGGLAEQIGELLSRLYRYLARVMMPTLILPRDCGVTLAEISNNPGLVIQPTSGAVSSGIRYMEIPSLPADTMRLYQMLLTMFDRVYQIEDADRGDTPNRIIAASAIVALQERNAVLMRHKIRSVDFLIRQRGRAVISFLQNFGVISEIVKLEDSVATLKGIDLLGRKFSYVVESGSTIPQTSLEVKEQALDLYKLGAIDPRGLLETLQFPDWRRIVERMAEKNGLDQALMTLVQAGLPEQDAMALKQMLEQTQGAPGDAVQTQR